MKVFAFLCTFLLLNLFKNSEKKKGSMDTRFSCETDVRMMNFSAPEDLRVRTDHKMCLIKSTVLALQQHSQ